MTDVRFDLEPHQWPPHARGERLGFADAVFAVEWDGAEVEVAARIVNIHYGNALLYFRRVESDLSYTVSFQSGQRFALNFFQTIFIKKNPAAFAKHEVRKAIAGHGASYGYAVHVSLPKLKLTTPQWLFLLHDGTHGTWQGELPGHSTPFLLDDFRQLTLDIIRDPDSSPGFALRWSQLADDEKMHRAVCCGNGTLEELRKLVWAVAVLDPVAAKCDQRAIYYMNGEFIMGQRTFTGFEWAPPNSRRRRWALHFHRYFDPHIDRNLATRHLCIAQHFISSLVSLKLTTPTQHERLEAALTLREWAKGVISDHEARLLLPKF